MNQFSEDMCAECEEPYATTEENCDWIRCVDCRKWLHELYSVYSYVDRRNSCGKQLFEKQRNQVKQLILPQWGISTSPSGEMAKKAILKNEKQ
jgi:hypothetical protein